jgi:hypothetical protein
MDWSPIKAVVSGIAKPFVEGYKANQTRKQAKETGKAKLAQAKLQSDTQVTLTDAEWEAINASKQDSTWKDEYVTIVVTAPLVGILAGGVVLAFTGDSRLLDGVNTGLQALAQAGVDMGELMYAVVLAAIGLKVWRAK